MRRIACALLALAMALCLWACSDSGGDAADGSEPREENSVVVFADSSLAAVLPALGDSYMAMNPGVHLSFIFGSSQALETGILAGERCDLFISASQTAMDMLEGLLLDGGDTDAAEAAADGEGEAVSFAAASMERIYPETRVDLLENRVVLVTGADNAAGLRSLDDLGDRLRDSVATVAIGSESEAQGRCARQILSYYGLDEGSLAAMGLIKYGSGVKDLVALVSGGEADGGIMFAADAAVSGLTVIDAVSGEMCDRAIYPAAVVRGGSFPLEANNFLTWLRGEEAASLLEGTGLTPPAE